MIVDKINQLTSQDIFQYQEYHAITLIDTYGFRIQNTGNFFYFCSNLLNEAFIGFFNHQRFIKEKKEFDNQGLSEFYQEVFYVDNLENLKKLNMLIKIMETNKTF